MRTPTEGGSATVAPMKKICVANQKGGSGKTHLAAMLILSMASKGRTLAIDCDPQGGLTSFFTEKGKPSLFDFLSGIDLQTITVTRGELSFEMIRADHRLDSIYSQLQPFAMEKLLKDVHYDYVIMDCPPTTMGITRAAALCADLVLIPCDISKATIDPVLYTIEAMKEVKKKPHIYILGNKPVDKEGHNKEGYVADLTREMIEAFGEYFAGFFPRAVAVQKAVAGITMPGDKKLQHYREAIS